MKTNFKIGVIWVTMTMLVAIAALTLWLTGAGAEPALPPAPGEDEPSDLAYMYIIGISEYQNGDTSLVNAVPDAQAVRDLMASQYQFSRDPQSGRFIERYNQNATRNNIISDLATFAKKLKVEDSIFIYYSGHGHLDRDIGERGLGYWFPWDGQGNNPGTLVSNDDILGYLKLFKARHIWLVSDSCFSGSLVMRAIEDAPLEISDQLLQQLDREYSRQIMTSGGIEPVADAAQDIGYCKGHSIFACFFLKYLRENQEPYLTPQMLIYNVARAVRENSSTGQTPRLQIIQGAGDTGGQFVLIRRGRPGLPQQPPISNDPVIPKPPVEIDLGQLLEADEIDINQTNDANLPFRFNDDRPYVISMNNTVPGVNSSLFNDLKAGLAKKGLLKDVVFEWFGKEPPKILEIAIGRRIPVAIAQVVIRACSNRCPQDMVLSIIDNDAAFGHTQRIYIGSYVLSGNDPLSDQKIQELLKPGLSQERFLQLVPHR